MTRIQREGRSAFKRVFKDRAYVLHKIGMFEHLTQGLCYEGKAQFGNNLKRAREITAWLSGKIKKYVKVEEGTLFPFLEKRVPKLEILILHFRMEHKNVKDSLRSLERSLRLLAERRSSPGRTKMAKRICRTGVYSAHLLRHHLKSEEEYIEQTLGHDLQSKERREIISLLAQASGGPKKH